MIDLPTDLPADLAPLSWLIGVWEGTGVIDYEAATTGSRASSSTASASAMTAART